MSQENEVQNIYIIPDNFIDEGRVINGLFKTRNFVEGTVLAAVALGISSLFNFESLGANIMVRVIATLPMFLFGVAGVNNDPLSKWFLDMVKYKKQKKLMLYNGHIKEKSKEDDNIFFAETVKDKFLKKIAGNEFKSKEESDNEILVEGIDFVFRDDKTKLRVPSAISIVGKKGKLSKTTEDGAQGFKLSFINPEDDTDNLDLPVFIDDGEYLQTDDTENSDESWIPSNLIFTDELIADENVTDEDGDAL